MREADHAPPPEPTVPDGPVRCAWFGGLIDGRRQDDEALRAAVERGNQLGLVHLDLELDGGKFSVLFDDSAVAGDDMSAKKSSDLLEVLQQIVAASAEPGRVESTLRCTEVYEDGAVETLFSSKGGKIECISRPRALTAQDHAHAIAAGVEAEPLPPGSRRQLLGLLALLLVAFAALAWQGGLVDRIAAKAGEQLEVDPGPFGATLAVETTTRWGMYKVTLRQGDAWPRSSAAAQAAIDAAGSVTEGAAMRAIADGGAIWLQLQDGQGNVLDAARIKLVRLLTEGKDPKDEVELRGRIAARRLVLALDSGSSDD
ncbi:MAG: hypothetical protein O2816_07980 [Planctomycetota bacterium]|nr:hypothetical protein [Planctomycetota bacterium]